LPETSGAGALLSLQCRPFEMTSRSDDAVMAQWWVSSAAHITRLLKLSLFVGSLIVRQRRNHPADQIAAALA
jgi:hypothetical protein